MQKIKKLSKSNYNEKKQKPKKQNYNKINKSMILA